MTSGGATSCATMVNQPRVGRLELRVRRLEVATRRDRAVELLGE
jgi:hypothetical protein